jgi:hypothetical protein
MPCHAAAIDRSGTFARTEIGELAASNRLPSKTDDHLMATFERELVNIKLGRFE